LRSFLKAEKATIFFTRKKLSFDVTPVIKLGSVYELTWFELIDLIQMAI